MSRGRYPSAPEGNSGEVGEVVPATASEAAATGGSVQITTPLPHISTHVPQIGSFSPFRATENDPQAVSVVN